MTTFLLVRHGSTDWVGKGLAGRLPGVGLDAAGRIQAQEVAKRLAGRPISAIYSSPVQRAVETAEPLASTLGLPIQTREAFTEIDFGAWQGMQLADLEGDAHWRRFNMLPGSVQAPGGELLLQVQARMAMELDNLRQQHRKETVAVFSHADVIKSALMLYLNMPLDTHLRLEISPASLSVLQLADWGPRILAVNS
ncbi:MAG TPA: histidine phosphatase family protein [Bryobacteraceae bacterium]|nr:histidine phosphatase family protein [Bryobacteraceae bacterium]